MIAYLDTSALARRYLPEGSSDLLKRLLRTQREIAVASITFAEVCAGVARAHRSRRISAAELDRILERIPTDFELFTIVEPKWRSVLAVSELVRRHPLRGFDALQLASCMQLRRITPTELWAADGELIRAARAEGLKVVSL